NRNAGTIAAIITLLYGIFKYSAIINAAAPIIGGVIIPPVEATASTAPACLGLKPTFFIKGIVKVPVVATLATGDPDNIPINPLETTAVLAGPPLYFPVKA